MSSTIEIIPYQPGHHLLIDLSATDAAWVDARNRLGVQATHGPTWSMLIDKRIVAIGGVVVIWPGLGEAWLVADQRSRGTPLRLARACRRGIAYTMQSLLLRRLQAHVKTSDKRAIRFADFMGFRRVATLRKYGTDGSDYDLFEIVR